MGNLIRIDAELVRRGLARSRAEAAELVRAKSVFLDGICVTKPARQMNRASALVVKKPKDALEYASRGAYKLIGALEYLGANGPKITNVIALDAGASTGGFTDVLLRRGAAHVTAVDVGYGQILWRLREDKRVSVVERTNIRTLKAGDITPAPQLVVGDLSFISLTYVIPALVAVSDLEAEFLLMVKPQFEVGKELLGAGGVVRDPKLHLAAVMKVALAAIENGLQICAAAPSPLPGPAGNVEYFLYLKKKHTEKHTEKQIATATLTPALTQLPMPAQGLEIFGAELTVQLAKAILTGPAAQNVQSITELDLPKSLHTELEKELANFAQTNPSAPLQPKQAIPPLPAGESLPENLQNPQNLQKNMSNAKRKSKAEIAANTAPKLDGEENK